jgi:hypothetical protein
MVWCFERRGQYLEYEVRHTNDDLAYELMMRYPDAPTHLERLEDPDTLIERFKETQRELRQKGWMIAEPTDQPGLR